LLKTFCDKCKEEIKAILMSETEVLRVYKLSIGEDTGSVTREKLDKDLCFQCYMDLTEVFTDE